MTAKEISQALFFELPIVDNSPTNGHIEYEKLTAIEYTHNRESGGYSVGLRLQSYSHPNGARSFTTARMRDCALKMPSDKEPPTIEIPGRIKKAFEKFKPVRVKSESFSGEWDEITKIVITLDENKMLVFLCEFSDKYERHVVPVDAVTIREKDKIDYQAVVNLFGEILPSLPKPLKLSESRRAAIRAAVRDGVQFNVLFHKVANSSFLMHKCNACRFDWILKPANRMKILEGNYDDENDYNRKNRQPASYDIHELEIIR